MLKIIRIGSALQRLIIMAQDVFKCVSLVLSQATKKTRKNDFLKKKSDRREEKRGRMRIFSLSLINNQNLVSLKNPPSIEFNTSIFGVRVPSFQFILINIQKNQREFL